MNAWIKSPITAAVAIAMTIVLWPSASQAADMALSDVHEAIAVVQPTKGHTAKGVVHFSEMDGKLRITIDLEGLEPNTSHGFHIHQYGDSSAEDGTSTGGHFAPDGHRHGAPDAVEHHAGDLGNVRSDANGNVHQEMTVDFITIAGPKNPILGRAVILHEGEDDLTSQPTGAAGARIGYGVIGIAKPKD